MPDPVVFENGYVAISTSTGSAFAELTGNKSVEMPISRAELADSAAGDLAEATYPGVLSAPLTLVHRQDFAAGGVDVQLWPLFLNRRPIRVKVRAVDAAVATTNPSYRYGKAYITALTPLSGGHGQALENRVEIRLASGGNHFSRSTST